MLQDIHEMKLLMQTVAFPLAMLLFLTAGSAAVYGSQDGDGTARTIPADSLVAGSRATIIITFTVATGGIPVGGGVMLGLHHVSGFRDLQITQADKTGYSRVEGETPDNFEPTWYPQSVPAGTIADPEDRLFYRGLIAKVRKRALAASEKVRLVLGANNTGVRVQTTTEATSEFRILTDGDGDRTYLAIDNSPTVAIVPNVAHHLYATKPATLVKNEPFELRLRAEDEFFNLATSCLC
jgi:hypothetical protein